MLELVLTEALQHTVDGPPKKFTFPKKDLDKRDNKQNERKQERWLKECLDLHQNSSALITHGAPVNIQMVGKHKILTARSLSCDRVKAHLAKYPIVFLYWLIERTNHCYLNSHEECNTVLGTREIDGRGCHDLTCANLRAHLHDENKSRLSKPRLIDKPGHDHKSSHLSDCIYMLAQAYDKQGFYFSCKQLQIISLGLQSDLAVWLRPWARISLQNCCVALCNALFLLFLELLLSSNAGLQAVGHRTTGITDKLQHPWPDFIFTVGKMIKSWCIWAIYHDKN